MAARHASLALDTSCIVALVCAWHERHEATLPPLDAALTQGATLVVVGHALVESYAVLTRLPAPHRMSPADALATLAGSFREARLVGVASREIWPVLGRLAASGVAGGRTYDAWIAAAAIRGGASRLVTWNPSHFAAWQTEGFRVLTPPELS